MQKRRAPFTEGRCKKDTAYWTDSPQHHRKNEWHCDTDKETVRYRNLQSILSAVIAATRKTCPGFHVLDKKAVAIGGGDPHRMNLSDGILIKDNHLALVPLGIAIEAAKKSSVYKKIEVEAETPENALLAAKAGADIIMLDNMSPLR